MKFLEDIKEAGVSGNFAKRAAKAVEFYVDTVPYRPLVICYSERIWWKPWVRNFVVLQIAV